MKTAKRQSSQLRLAEAARELGVSYPTLKQWIYKKKIAATRTAGGHYRIPAREIARINAPSMAARAPRGKPQGIDAISGRNKLPGVIVGIKREGLLVQIAIKVDRHMLSAVITRDACDELGLKVGSDVYALMKATEVMVVRA